jgi:hypothetical protein
MSNIFNDNEITHQDADALARKYRPSVQELQDEAPDDAEDRTPISDDERAGLDEASRPSFEPVLPAGQPNERAVTFVPPSDVWVHPKIKAARRQQALFPSSRALDDLDQRIAKVVKVDGAPESVLAAESTARGAVAQARQVRADGGHPDNPRYAVSTDAKDAAAVADAQAVLAVSALENAASAAAEEWFDGLTARVSDLREEAAEALEAAARAYAQWRQTIAAAEALGREQGKWGDWHHHPDARELNPLGLIAELRKARDIARSEDDWVSGAYLTKEYDGIPPHTMASLEKSARIAPGSFAESVLLRLKGRPHPADTPALETIEARDLRIINTRPIPALNSAQAAWDAHARAVDPARG